MMELTINVPGLQELAEAIKRMAESTGVVAMDSRALAEEAQKGIQNTTTAATNSAQTVAPMAQPMTSATATQPTTQAPVVKTVPPVQQTPVVHTQPLATVPTSVQSYTLDDLARASMTLMDAGRQGDLQQLLIKFGVSSLPELKPEQYGTFATALREMGAQI